MNEFSGAALLSCNSHYKIPHSHDKITRYLPLTLNMDVKE